MNIEDARKLKVGDIVCDCRFKHLAIASLKKEKHDVDVVLEDGANMSAVHCLDLVPHDWDHVETPTVEVEYVETSSEGKNES